MADQVSVEVITPEGLKLQENVYEVLLPTPQGEIGILPNHIPLITIVSAGVLTIRRRASDPDSSLEYFATSGGFVEIDGKRVRVLADSAERAEDIDEFKVQEALTQARKLTQLSQDQMSLADATALIEHSLARLKVAQLKRRHHR